MLLTGFLGEGEVLGRKRGVAGTLPHLVKKILLLRPAPPAAPLLGTDRGLVGAPRGRPQGANRHHLEDSGLIGLPFGPQPPEVAAERGEITAEF